MEDICGQWGCFCSIIISKSLDWISHNLIIVKLAGHGFDTSSLKLIHNYLFKRRQRVNINSAYNV